ncbi:hypothetical protein ABZP36_031942 [Zizania latifolia]
MSGKAQFTNYHHRHGPHCSQPNPPRGAGAGGHHPPPEAQPPTATRAAAAAGHTGRRPNAQPWIPPSAFRGATQTRSRCGKRGVRLL